MRRLTRNSVAVVASVVALSAVTSWATMRTVAARHEANPEDEPRRARPGPWRDGGKVMPLAATRPPAGTVAPMGPGDALMKYRIGGEMARVGRVVAVNCNADYANRMWGSEIVWRVRLLDPEDGAVLSSTLYSDQRLLAPAGHGASMDFNDLIDLPPGRFQVEVGYLSVAAGSQLGPGDLAEREPLKALRREYTVE